MNETYLFTQGRKYVKAYTVDGNGRNAVAFRSPDGSWLESASWTEPSRRQSMMAAELEKAYRASRAAEDLAIFELGVHGGYE